MFLRRRRVLLGLVTAAAAFAALPASALADFTASLSLDQTAGTTAGSSPAIGFDAKFASTTGDGVKSTTITLPPGLLTNESIAGGACVLSSTPNPACQVGTGTLSLAGGGSGSLTVYLVKPPNPGDIFGLGFGSASGLAITSDVTLEASGGATIGSNLAATTTETNFSFTDLRLPSSCPSPAANVTMTAVSQAGVSATATAPLVVTGCSGLSYAPTLAVSEAKDAKDNGATLGFDIMQAPGEAASKTIVLKLPRGLGVNLAADVTCLTGAGSGCVVGTATATSPLAPKKLNGTVTLGGSATSPTVTVSFPAPFAITLVGDVSLTGGTVAINNVPDIPLTDLNLTITGPNGQKAFTTNCTPSSTTGTFTSQSGVTKTVASKVTLTNCAPTASGSASGLATGHPKLRIKASHGQGAANIASVAVGLRAGLKFSRSGVTKSNTCVTTHGKKKCTTKTLINGLKVSGASVKSVGLKGGKLVITLKNAAGSVTVNLNGPVLTETSSLQSAVNKHKVNSVTVALKITDAKHTTTSLPLKLNAR
jgi:hypothetical protein